MALEIDVNTNGSRFFATNTNWSLDIIITNGIESCDFITDLLILEIAAEIPFYLKYLIWAGVTVTPIQWGFLL